MNKKYSICYRVNENVYHSLLEIAKKNKKSMQGLFSDIIENFLISEKQNNRLEELKNMVDLSSSLSEINLNETKVISERIKEIYKLVENSELILESLKRRVDGVDKMYDIVRRERGYDKF